MKSRQNCPLKNKTLRSLMEGGIFAWQRHFWLWAYQCGCQRLERSLLLIHQQHYSMTACYSSRGLQKRRALPSCVQSFWATDTLINALQNLYTNITKLCYQAMYRWEICASDTLTMQSRTSRTIWHIRGVASKNLNADSLKCWPACLIDAEHGFGRFEDIWAAAGWQCCRWQTYAA